MINPQHLKIRIMSEKKLPINPVVEAELRKILDDIWENRLQLTSDFNLKQLRSFTNKSKVVFK